MKYFSYFIGILCICYTSVRTADDWQPILHECVSEKCDPTIFEKFNVSPVADAHQVYAALREQKKGALLELFTNRNFKQRHEIIRSYQRQYGEKFNAALKRSLNRGNSRDLLETLIKPIDIQYTQTIRHAVNGPLFGVKSEILLEILGTLSKTGIKKVNNTFAIIYKRNLVEILQNQVFFNHDVKQLIIDLIEIGRSENPAADDSNLQDDIDALMNSELTGITDLKVFKHKQFISTKEYQRRMYDAFEKSAHHSLEKSLQMGCKTGLREALIALYKITKDRAIYFAERLHQSLSKWMVDHKTLRRILVSRSEIDLANVKEAYQKRYDDSLVNLIKKKTHGEYRHALLNLIREGIIIPVTENKANIQVNSNQTTVNLSRDVELEITASVRKRSDKKSR